MAARKCGKKNFPAKSDNVQGDGGEKLLYTQQQQHYCTVQLAKSVKRAGKNSPPSAFSLKPTPTWSDFDSIYQEEPNHQRWCAKWKPGRNACTSHACFLHAWRRLACWVGACKQNFCVGAQSEVYQECVVGREAEQGRKKKLFICLA